MVDSKQARRTGSSATTRARGRELALWLLCHLESHPGQWQAGLELFWLAQPEFDEEFSDGQADKLRQILADAGARRWARRLSQAYVESGASVDARIEAVSERWRLARMDRVDRNLLRMVAVELIGERTPRPVVVSEAVRLAVRYGSERSPTFVNGLAEALARELRASDGSEAAGGEDASGGEELGPRG